MKLFFCGILIATLCGFFAFLYMQHPSGSLYVDSSVFISGNGSDRRPIKSLNRALEIVANRSDADRVLIVRGSHGGVFEIPSGTTLSGEGETSIDGRLVVLAGDERETVLRAVLISGEGYGIEVLSDAKVRIEDVVVADNEDSGIDIGIGATAVLSEVEITRNRKGIYSRMDSQLTLTQSRVVANVEEGVDVRSGVVSVIHNNVILRNGESGIEYVVGRAQATVSQNEISQNESSGITVQYYEDHSDYGALTFSGNTIKQNESKGFKCDFPGGRRNKPLGYFNASVTLEDNIISDNLDGDITTKCKLVDDEVSGAVQE